MEVSPSNGKKPDGGQDAMDLEKETPKQSSSASLAVTNPQAFRENVQRYHFIHNIHIFFFVQINNYFITHKPTLRTSFFLYINVKYIAMDVAWLCAGFFNS